MCVVMLYILFVIVYCFIFLVAILLRCCSLWLSETGQHMPLICVYRSHVSCSVDFSVSYMLNVTTTKCINRAFALNVSKTVIWWDATRMNIWHHKLNVYSGIIVPISINYTSPRTKRYCQSLTIINAGFVFDDQLRISADGGYRRFLTPGSIIDRYRYNDSWINIQLVMSNVHSRYSTRPFSVLHNKYTSDCDSQSVREMANIH
jgi:hypothetical protein